MDLFETEILNFWSALQNNGVRYIMVGGYAANLHAYQRYTDNMDLWIEDTPANRQRLKQAFIDCEMDGYFMLESTQFVLGWTEFKLINGLRLNILVNMKGLDDYGFDGCLHAATIADIDGVSIPILHIDHLIANKRVVNRPKDQLDVVELQLIRKIQSEV